MYLAQIKSEMGLASKANKIPNLDDMSKLADSYLGKGISQSKNGNNASNNSMFVINESSPLQSPMSTQRLVIV